MDKRPIGYKPGETYVLDKKIKKTGKYSHVKKTLDTGKTKEDVDIISKKIFNYFTIKLKFPSINFPTITKKIIL